MPILSRANLSLVFQTSHDDRLAGLCICATTPAHIVADAFIALPGGLPPPGRRGDESLFNRIRLHKIPSKQAISWEKKLMLPDCLGKTIISHVN